MDTTFYSDFSIADKFGESAVRDTYRRARAEWGDNIKYWTELVVALNHKIWQHYETNEPLARVYNELWQSADAETYEKFKGDDIKYYYKQTD